MYYEKPRVYIVNGAAYFEIGHANGEPIIAKVELGPVPDKLAAAYKLAEMPVAFFYQYEEKQ